ncbi:MAG: hypothetical protein ABRQ26_14400 [Syntrophomonadaceae bacterium]
MQSEEGIRKYLWLVFGLAALAIAAYVLFQPPQPGLADQGDFDRIMFIAGIEPTPENLNDPDSVRFLDYPVTEYKISEPNPLRLLAMLAGTSMAYLISFISLTCKLLGQDTFKTSYLALVYLIMYLSALYITLKYLNIKSRAKLALFMLIALLVFLDGNYLVWFNSLYGEPMMITSLALYIAAWTYYIYQRRVLKSEAGLFNRILFIFAAAFLLIGSKLQVVSALPVILLMLAGLWRENRRLLKKDEVWLFGILYVFLMIYPAGFSLANRSIYKETQYNAVFYGILKDSPSPAQDLLNLDLNPDLAVDAGKHAFLPKEEYAKYVPHSELTEDQFYSRMSNGKLIKFYLTHPARFIKGMEYTAGQAFTTSTFLGKYSRQYSEEPVREFDRFTLWSSLRDQAALKNPWFILSIYFLVMIVLLYEYIKRPSQEAVRARIRLLWSVMAIGLLQFPMPLVGNGQADTAKQLFLFNFIFDLMLVVSACWCLHRFIDRCQQKRCLKADASSTPSP